MKTGCRMEEQEMRAINYMKIDYMLTKQQMRILPLVLIVAVLVGRSMGDVWLMYTCSYLLFIGTIFSTTPFGSCQRKNTGFLLMLPATVTQRVLGRFLFGVSYVAIAVLLCAAAMGAFSLFGFEVTPAMFGIFLCNIACSLLIVALEYLISYVFGEGRNNWQYVGNIVRIAPGMAMFFLIMFVLGKMDEETYVADRMEFLAQKIVSAGAAALAVALAAMVLAVVISIKVIEKRDYA